MAGPVTTNGSITVTIDAGRTLVVTGEAGAKGSVALLNGSAVESVDTINGTQSETYGPYATNRTCRLYAEAGKIGYQLGSSLSALPGVAAPTISADGKTISGTGVKPGTTVPVYNADTGVPFGQATSLADGSWSLTLKADLAAGTRVGFDPVIVGPSATLFGNSGSTPPSGTGSALNFTDPANSGLQPTL